MKKAYATILAIGLAVHGGAAFAQDYQAAVLAQLRQDGYSNIIMTTTFLGRIRFIAQGADGQREIVLNPRTGEVLRDMWLLFEQRSGSSKKGASSGPWVGPSGGSSGSGGDEDDNDDSGGDDDDDNSGSGGGSDDND